MAKEIQLPYAIDERGRVVAANDGEKGQRYRCPSCGDNAVLKKGAVRVPHFAHKANAACSQETVLHKTAKLLLCNVINEAKQGGTTPHIHRRCSGCWGHKSQLFPSGTVDQAVEELRTPDGSIVDVGLLRKGAIVAAIEVLVTHAVDEEKAARLEIPFIELEAEKVIANPYFWEPTQDRFRPYVCPECKHYFTLFDADAKLVAERTGQSLPSSYFRHGLTRCGNCTEPIIVYAWPLVHGEELPFSPPACDPPPTIQARTSHRLRYGRDADRLVWLNTCPFCDATQGDGYFYRSEAQLNPSWRSGAFNGLKMSGDTAEEFSRDMQRIARRYVDNGGIGI